jgi:hypothetical protein
MLALLLWLFRLLWLFGKGQHAVVLETLLFGNKLQFTNGSKSGPD